MGIPVLSGIGYRSVAFVLGIAIFQKINAFFRSDNYCNRNIVFIVLIICMSAIVNITATNNRNVETHGEKILL